MNTLEPKILKALDATIDDGNIYRLASGSAAFGLQGALSFIETLIALCSEDERSELFVDWIFNDAGNELIKAFFSQMVSRTEVNYLTDHMEILAEKLLTHYGTEVDQLLSKKARVNPYERFVSDFNNVFNGGKAA
jgi:hypothetical protein